MKKTGKLLLTALLAAVCVMLLLTGCGEAGKVGKRAQPPQTPPSPRMEEEQKENPDSLPEKAGEMIQNEEGMMMAEGIALRDVVTKLGEEMGITMPQRLEEKDLQEILGLKPEDVEEYYGEYSSVGTSADHIIGIKAKKGKAEQVKQAMETRKEEIIKKFAEYLPQEQEKARCGKIIEKGDYLFLVIAGNDEDDCNAKGDKVQQIIDKSFQNPNGSEK